MKWFPRKTETFLSQIQMLKHAIGGNSGYSGKPYLIFIFYLENEINCFFDKKRQRFWATYSKAWWWTIKHINVLLQRKESSFFSLSFLFCESLGDHKNPRARQVRPISSPRRYAPLLFPSGNSGSCTARARLFFQKLWFLFCMCETVFAELFVSVSHVCPLCSINSCC